MGRDPLSPHRSGYLHMERISKSCLSIMQMVGIHIPSGDFKVTGRIIELTVSYQ